MTTVYGGTFSSGTDLGGQQLGYLEEMFDQTTMQFIGAVTAREGQRCLDLGAGNGSIVRWLAGRTGPTGQVAAVDIDDTHLVVPPGVRVFRHDVNEGLPDQGPFDLIHTRLLLVHLKRRREILTQLTDALAPGGWLITGDFTYPCTEPITAPSRADAQLFQTVLETGLNKVGRPAGQNYEWGHEVDAALTTAGYCNVDTIELTQTTYGGAGGCLLLSNYVHQMDAPLRSAGLTAEDLTRFHELMFDPRLRAQFFPFVYSRGQKPMTA